MGLIKSGNLATATAAFSLTDIELQARALLARAKAQADQILAAANQQAQAIKAAAERDAKAAKPAAIELGKKEGRDAAMTQALPQAKAQALTEEKARLTDAIGGLADASTTLNGYLESLEGSVQVDLVALAVGIARRVTRVVADRDVAVVEANVRDAIRLVIDKSSVRIAIAPIQLEAIQALLPSLKITWPTLKHAELIADESLTPGSCRVYSASGEIDAAVDAQLDRITSELQAAGS